MLELYYSESCPYCRKVINHFDINKITFMPKDISINENYEILMKEGGKNQVPFLIDTDKKIKMYESDKIIEYANTLGKI